MPNELSPIHSEAAAAEAVRLVVWDLDETFWRGTLTEGGISEYVQAHHDIIIELARRGIMSSVCSKNDADVVLPILREKGILEYIIFPSISWDSKGMRLAQMIDTVQLRSATVMFIDDNPNNLAEARAMIPDIQLEDETFITRMLDDRRFKGKDDSKLSRLAQYKLLETRKADEAQASGNNAEFLRGCDIRVYVEHDVETHVDRAIELINRTNQLNYTKSRLPDDMDKARRTLLGLCRLATHQVGLVRVIDRYGDYGFVGFFMMKNRRTTMEPGLANQTLLHYCFSCRTLGMLVEQWFYNYLRRPELTVVGEVLTDLTVEREIDWVRLITSMSEATQVSAPSIPEIRVFGGCEANAVAHFLGAHSGAVKVIGNFAAGALFVRVNGASILLSAGDHAGDVYTRELESMGISAPLMGGDYFKDAVEGTVFVFSGGLDGAPANQTRSRHKVHGWELRAVPNGTQLDLGAMSDAQIADLVKRTHGEAEKEQLAFVARHLRENYQSVPNASGPALEAQMEDLLKRVPDGCKLIILLDDERVRKFDRSIRIAPWKVRYNKHMKEIAARFAFAAAISVGDFIESEDEIHVAGNHYDRMTYFRLSQKIVEVAAGLPAKGARVLEAV